MAAETRHMLRTKCRWPIKCANCGALLPPRRTNLNWCRITALVSNRMRPVPKGGGDFCEFFKMHFAEIGRGMRPQDRFTCERTLRKSRSQNCAAWRCGRAMK